MDGTVYLSDKLLPGAKRFLQLLDKQGKEYFFLTNNSSKAPSAYAEKLEKLGLPTPIERIMSSGQATVALLQRDWPKVRVDVFGTPSLLDEFRNGGLQLETEKPDLVVLGFDQTLDYPKICRLCDHVRAGVPYWTTHPDKNCPIEGGYLPDTGAMVEMVAASTGRYPDRVIGKPNADIIEAIYARTGRTADELAMCGDRLNTDVLTGLNANVTAVLVLSGATSREDLAKSDTKPDFVYENLGAIADDIA